MQRRISVYAEAIGTLCTEKFRDAAQLELEPLLCTAQWKRTGCCIGTHTPSA